MTEDGALYVGTVMHQRLRPRRHRLRYRVFWLLIDIDRIEALARRLRLFSLNRFNLFGLDRRDHGDGSDRPQRAQIEAKLVAAGIPVPGGPIRLLTMPRVLGYAFNPISVHFCHRPDGTLAALVHEVHNTFGERHSYALPVDDAAAGGSVSQRCAKSLHVSPFLGLDMDYAFRVTPPGERVAVAISASDGEGTVLVAALSAQRRPLTDAALARAFLAIPLLTLKVTAGIHWEALLIWLKGVRVHHHPGSTEGKEPRAVSR